VLRSRTLKLLGMGESAVEEALGELVRSTAPTVATYAKSDGVHVRITDKGPRAGDVDQRIAAMEGHVRERLGAHVWGVDGETIGGAVARSLAARGWSLATAESLTGGELARTLIESGAGDRYVGGVVRPGSDVGALESLLGTVRAHVVVFTPELADGRAWIVARLNGRDRRVDIPHRTIAEARRRAVLGALDLLRRL
jgi:nicotinamide-nucleotide amidase